MDIISLVVALIVVRLVFWAVSQLGAAFGIPAPIITVITVLLVIIVVLYFVQALQSGAPLLRLR